MTQFSDDDKDLVNFLRQHRPEVPPASPILEEQILRDIQKLHVSSLTKPPLVRHSRLWLVPSIVAAGFLAAVVGYRTLIPSTPSATELASLETFIETNWQGTISETTEGNFDCSRGRFSEISCWLTD